MWNFDNTNAGPQFERFGGYSILRPRLWRELEVRLSAGKWLRSDFKIGTYTDSEVINSIIKHQFSFFSDMFKSQLPRVFSIDLLELVLYHYDRSASIDELYRDRRLDSDEGRRWAELGPNLRRGLKYLAERIVMIETERLPRLRFLTPEMMLSNIEDLLVCAENMAQLYVLSDQTYMLYPDSTILEILPEGDADYWKIIVTSSCSEELGYRIESDMRNRGRYVEDWGLFRSPKQQDNFLQHAFRETIGISYLEALKILTEIIDRVYPSQEGPRIPIVRRSEVVKAFSNDLDCSEKTVERVISGFSVSGAALRAEGREIWKPKQEYRAFRRGFFEIPSPIGPHLAFSKGLATEGLLTLTGGVVFQQMPSEWRSEGVDRAVAAMSNEVGRWFESIVTNNLANLGIFGPKALKGGIGQGSSRIIFPHDIGEIDFLGYSPSQKLLVVGECKLVEFGSEPKHFRDDKHNFVTGRDNYFAKFNSKLQWIRANADRVTKALSSIYKYDEPATPTHIAGVMLTYYPTIASCWAAEFPCVTITELIMEHERKNGWPFELGVYSV